MNLDCYIKFIYKTDKLHPIIKDVISIFVYDLNLNSYKFYNISHPDIPSNYSFEQFKNEYKNKKILLINKKDYDYFIDNFPYILDVGILYFIKSGEIIPKYVNEEYSYENNSGIITPYIIHQNIFLSEVDDILDFLDKYDIKDCINEYKFYNDLSDTLYQIERNGLSIDRFKFNQYFENHYDSLDGNLVYSSYNILTTTGRPSNSYDKINFSALNKNNNCRSSFVSRFNKGRLLLMDFSAYHPTIASKLIHYQFNDDISIYNHLGKLYFQKDILSDDEIQYIKKNVMLLFYGDNINSNLSYIEYFKRVNILKHNIWMFYNKNRYILTPIYKRKLLYEQIGEVSENKLFSYYIQAVETEINIRKLNLCIKYCKNISNSIVIPILYVYDSIMFDTCNLSINVINDLKNILESGNFKIKTYIGENYNNLTLIK